MQITMMMTTNDSRYGLLLNGHSYDVDDATGMHLIKVGIATEMKPGPGGVQPDRREPAKAPAEAVSVTREGARGLLPDKPSREPMAAKPVKPTAGVPINAPSKPRDGKG